MYHLVAFSRIVDIIYMHNVSLSTEPEERQRTLANPQEKEKRYEWRYRFRWREPQRVGDHIDDRKGRFWYWLLLEGTVEEKLKEYDEQQRVKATEGQKIWDFLELDMQKDPTRWMDTREERFQQASDYMANFHQQNYEKGVRVDPLGEAVQQRLGVGLAFGSWDHNKRLEKCEQPTTRRLHARAAKSALKRINYLWQDFTVQKKQITNDVKDSSEREEKIREMEQKIKDEAKYWGKRLLDLLPTDCPEGAENPLMIQGPSQERKFIKGENNELILIDPVDELKDSLLAAWTKSFKKRYEVVELDDDNNEMNMSDGSGSKKNATSPANNTTNLKTDEFLEEYLKDLEAIKLEEKNSKELEDAGGFSPEENASGELTSNTTTKIVKPNETQEDFAEMYLKQRFGGGGINSKIDDEDDDDDMDFVLA